MDTLSPPATARGHVVCLPCAAQSHISGMLKLAKLAYHKGFYVTFVNTESNHRRMLMSQGPSFVPPRGFRFLSIPDGDGSTRDNSSLCRASKTSFPTSFCQLIADLTANASLGITGSGAVFPPISCIIADAFWSFTAGPAADKFGIPLVLFCGVSPASFFLLKYYRAIKQNCLQQGKDYGESNETAWYLQDTTIDCIPDVGNLRLCDLPRSMGTLDPDDYVFYAAIEAAEMAHKSAAIIFHSSVVLECKVLDALSSHFPLVCPIGPLHLLLDQIPEDQNHLKHIGYNMWKEDEECLQWLNSREPKSVLYVNFGSIAALIPEQLVEFAMGICNSDQPFLWIIRHDLITGGINNTLPPKFMEETKERGFISSWCPQEAVLKHPSVGGFLTHCGWNSTLESICAGVPMLCWPCFGDQQTNCRLICSEWKIGLELSKVFKEDEVETLVRRLMQGEESVDMRKKAVELKKSIKEANAPNSPFPLNLNKLLEMISSKSLPAFHKKEQLRED